MKTLEYPVKPILENGLVSDWILTSCQPHKVAPGRQKPAIGQHTFGLGLEFRHNCKTLTNISSLPTKRQVMVKYTT